MKRHSILLTVIGLALCFIPSAVFAFEFSWQSPDADKSLFYLGQIFGPVGTALPSGSGNALISQLFSIFNIAVLSLGSIVVSYTIILSTINTAQEGEVMGRKWSSLWIPLRSAVGMAFLVPTASGYSLLQILMMEIVVYGVAAANQIWAKVVEGLSSGTGLKGTVNVGDTSTVAQSLLKSAICAEVLNTDTRCRSSMGSATVLAYLNNTVNASSPDAGKFYVGVQGDTSKSNICGAYSSGNVPAEVESPAAWYASNQLAFGLAYANVQFPASEIIAAVPASITDIEYTTKNIITGNLGSTPQKAVDSSSLDTATKQALDNGWLFAGSYYFAIISVSRTFTYSAPVVDVTPAKGSGQLANVTTACQDAYNDTLADMTTYLANSKFSATPGSVGDRLVLNTIPTPDGFAAAMDAINQPLTSFMNSFMLSLSTDDPRGAIPSLAGIGSLILNIAQIIWFAVIIAALLIMLPACIMEMFQPICAAVAAAFAIILPLTTAVVMIMWSIGAMIGIYLPMVPYLVFTFTALGWILLVVETIVAAPIVALGLVSPSGEHMGKAAPAVLIVVNVFLRPSLMVIGFVIASKLCDVMVSMLNYGFFATLSSSARAAGVFGAIATVALYGGVVIAIIHESFSLIHVLPDKIVRWIGGQAEQSRVKEQVAEAKKSAEKGAEMGGAIMKGVSGALQDKAKEWKSKGGGEEEGGGGKGGG